MVLCIGLLKLTRHDPTVCCFGSQVLVFVYVNTTAFSIFNEEHPQFHLSDALYTALEMMHVASATEATGADDAISANAVKSLASDGKDGGLEALFSDFIGSSSDEDEDAEHASGTEKVHAVSPGDQLVPFLKDIELRDHQKAAVRWMAARENQNKKSTSANQDASSPAEETNPVRCCRAHVLYVLCSKDAFLYCSIASVDVGSAQVPFGRLVFRQSVRESRVATSSAAASALPWRYFGG